jgi:predicted dehydrogenase
MAVKRLRVALMGAGMVGRAHAHAFAALRAYFHPAPAVVELALVADPNAALAREAQERFGFARVATSWEEVVEAADVDAACVALPNHQHRGAVEALLGRGKHVLCEKPLAPTAGDAWVMLQAARRAGVVHGVGFSQRRAPAVAAVQRAVARGDLGEPRHFSGRYFTDYAASPETPFTWRYQRDLAGAGALADIGSHVIDLARFLLGEIESVEGAVLETFVKERPVTAGPVIGHDRGAATGEMRPVENDDVAAFTARFRNGAVGDFRFSRIAAGYRNSPAFELVGSRGAAAVDLERPGELRFFDATREDDLSGFRRIVTGPRHPYFGQITSIPVAGVGHGYTETYLAQAYDFVRAVAGEDGEFRPDFGDGYAAGLVDEAVQTAAAQGRRVTIAELDAGHRGR